MNCLQLKKPDHHPNVPHKVEEVYDAAHFVLQGYSSFMQNLIAASSSQSPPQSQNYSSPGPAEGTNATIKTEDLGTILASFTKLIIEAINNNSHEELLDKTTCTVGRLSVTIAERNISSMTAIMSQLTFRPVSVKEIKMEKVVLPTEAFVSRDIVGRFLCNCVNEWHERYLNQLAVA